MSGRDEARIAAIGARSVQRLRLVSLGIATLLVAAVPSLRAGEIVAPWELGSPAPQTVER